jgi:hypothetical protein
MKIVFTVSPQRMVLTFRPVSAITANNASKAVVRAALDEFLRNHADDAQTSLYYFPGYELATEYFIDPFDHDNQHVSPTVAAGVVRYFVEHYCSADLIERTGESLNQLGGGQHLEQFIQHSRIATADSRSAELLERIANLENRAGELQRICDERRDVIEALDKAAQERLDVINVLDAEVKRLTA